MRMYVKEQKILNAYYILWHIIIIVDKEYSKILNRRWCGRGGKGDSQSFSKVNVGEMVAIIIRRRQGLIQELFLAAM